MAKSDAVRSPSDQTIRRGREMRSARRPAGIAKSRKGRVSALAREIGWSRKHLAERFSIEVGARPKTAGRILRFAGARRSIDAGIRVGPMDWADLAADWGYADQAHLIREFRAMAGVTPADYVQDVAGRFRAVNAEPR